MHRRHVAHVSDDRFDDDGRELVLATAEERVDRIEIVVPGDGHVAHHAVGDSTAGSAGGVRRRAGIEQREIEMPVVVSGKL